MLLIAPAYGSWTFPEVRATRRREPYVLRSTQPHSNGRSVMRLPRLLRASSILVALSGCAGNLGGDAPVATDTSELACTEAEPIVPLKELVIVDPSVVTSAQASNATDGTGGGLSFHHVMTRLAGPGANVAHFTEAFLRNWEVSHQVGAGTVPATPNGGLQALLGSPNFWPRLANGDLDMTRAPFRLLAVVNRLDLAGTDKPNGEGRLVYGVTSPSGNGIPMTVIFEFNLPKCAARADWAKRWHALGALEFGSAFNDALAALVEGYTAPSDLSQVRTSEVFLSNEWVLREFHLEAGALVTATTAQTPDFTLNNSAQLIAWVNANAEAILNQTHRVPAELLGGRSRMAFPALQNFNFSGTQWLMGDNGVPLVDGELRHAFANQTCNGCHQSDAAEGGQPVDIFYHVSPTRPVNVGDGTDRLSPFIRNIELPRRSLFLADLLPCAE
jgi:hypothetical protein